MRVSTPTKNISNSNLDLLAENTEYFLSISHRSKIYQIITEACNFIKKETLAQVCSYEFCEISKNTFFTEQLWTTVSAAIGSSI